MQIRTKNVPDKMFEYMAEKVETYVTYNDTIFTVYVRWNVGNAREYVR